MRKGYIYELICPITNECRYIGQTIQELNRRLYKHKYYMRNNPSHKNSWLIKLSNENLLDNLEIKLIERCDSDILNEREVYWIDKYLNEGYQLTNMTEGGNCGSRGYKHTREAIEKITEAGKKTGYKHTKEAKQKISDSLRGKKGRNTGNKHSDETKNKISETKKGFVSWNAKSVIQLTKEDSVIKEWRSAKYAAEELNLSQGNIWSVINGNRKTCGGYKWKNK